MSTETLTQAIGAGATVRFGAGTQFLVAAAASNIDIKAVKLGDSSQNKKFLGTPAGFKFTARDAGFDYLEVTSAAAQNVTLTVGTDDVSFSNQVTVAGNVSTAELPASAISTPGAKVTVVTAGAALVAANLARRRVTISSDPNNVAAVIYVRVSGGARIDFVMPGTKIEFRGTYALDYEATAAGDTLYISEES